MARTHNDPDQKRPQSGHDSIQVTPPMGFLIRFVLNRPKISGELALKIHLTRSRELAHFRVLGQREEGRNHPCFYERQYDAQTRVVCMRSGRSLPKGKMKPKVNNSICLFWRLKSIDPRFSSSEGAFQALSRAWLRLSGRRRGLNG